MTGVDSNRSPTNCDDESPGSSGDADFQQRQRVSAGDSVYEVNVLMGPLNDGAQLWRRILATPSEQEARVEYDATARQVLAGGLPRGVELEKDGKTICRVVFTPGTD